MQMRHRMFVVVLAAALFSGVSTADSCTVFLLPLVRGEGECSASGKLMNRIGQNVSALLPRALHCLLPGRTPKRPANSCAELVEQEPGTPSGNYWILNSTQSPVQVFCEMGDVFPAGLNVTGGWVRVANLNMTDPDQQCPENLQQSYTNQPIRLCGRRTTNDGPSCDSVTFTTYGVQYRQVCGRVRGYQFASPDAFERKFGVCPSCPTNIDNPYVDGVSITHGSPRKHIWTYAAALLEYPFSVFSSATCPCTGHGRSPPSFVGSDYYCESAISAGLWQSTVYSNDTLWDGEDCRQSERTCCDHPNLPWFCKEISEPTTDSLEFRICGDQSPTDEDDPIDLVQLYIQ